MLLRALLSSSLAASAPTCSGPITVETRGCISAMQEQRPSSSYRVPTTQRQPPHTHTHTPYGDPRRLMNAPPWARLIITLVFLPFLWYICVCNPGGSPVGWDREKPRRMSVAGFKKQFHKASQVWSAVPPTITTMTASWHCPIHLNYHRCIYNVC